MTDVFDDEPFGRLRNPDDARYPLREAYDEYARLWLRFRVALATARLSNRPDEDGRIPRIQRLKNSVPAKDRASDAELEAYEEHHAGVWAELEALIDSLAQNAYVQNRLASRHTEWTSAYVNPEGTVHRVTQSRGYPLLVPATWDPLVDPVERVAGQHSTLDLSRYKDSLYAMIPQ